MNAVVCWLWRTAQRPYRPEHVNVAQRMFARHLPLPHRFICITDEREGFDPAVQVLPVPAAARPLAALRSPEGVRFPSCYARLWTFSEEAQVLGDRVLMIDIDFVLTADVSVLFDRTEDFVGFRPKMKWGNSKRLGGGLFLLRTGSHTKVWTQFKASASIQKARAWGFRGSDQAWLSYCLGDTAAVYGAEAGLYSIRDMADGKRPLPCDARLVQFNGPQKPWRSPLPWVKEHWR